MTIAKQVEALIWRRGWSKTRLAQEIGIKPQQLSSILSGKRPGNKHIEAIARVLNVTVAELKAPYHADAQAADAPLASSPRPTEVVYHEGKTLTTQETMLMILHEVIGIRQELQLVLQAASRSEQSVSGFQKAVAELRSAYDAQRDREAADPSHKKHG